MKCKGRPKIRNICTSLYGVEKVDKVSKSSVNRYAYMHKVPTDHIYQSRILTYFNSLRRDANMFLIVKINKHTIDYENIFVDF